MAAPEILRQIESLNCPFVFRVVDRDKKDPGAGTAVLVCDQGLDHGFALACWHNIDWSFVHTDDWRRQEIVALPKRISALPASAHNLLKPGEEIQLMGGWSNPKHDVAVLRVPRSVITAFTLRPAPISFHVRPGARVIVRGFDRPWLDASLASYKAKVPDSMDPFTEFKGKQRTFSVWLDGVWQRGLSGGAVFDIEQGALIGIANAVKPDDKEYAVSRSHFEIGYAASMVEAGESWTDIRRHCQEVVPRGNGPRTWPLSPREERVLTRAQRFQPRPELEALRRFWTDAEGGGVIALVGIGGAGKTAMVQHFLEELRPRSSKTASLGPNLPQPHALFVWSFYDEPYPEKCLQQLLSYVDGDSDRMVKWSLSSLQALLAGVHRPRVLIVLDGVERVQHEKSMPGRLRHDAAPLRALLQWCAQGDSGVWAIATSRLAMTDLEPWAGRAYESIQIDRLKAGTAQNLLQTLGVHGSDAELEQLGHQFGGHALTMDGLGVFLNEFYKGSPEGVAELGPMPTCGPLRASEAEVQARRLAHLLAGYERKLHPEELSVMKAISAFRIPIDATTLELAFRWTQEAPPEERVQVPTGRRLLDVLARLCRLHLVHERTDATETVWYSTHPAVSQYFYRALQEDALRVHMGASAYLSRQRDSQSFPVPVRGAIRTRGAVRLRGSSDQRPTEPVLLDLLEEAVYHALKAGRVEEAWELYRSRLGGFDHLGGSVNELARGYRITEMFLQDAPWRADRPVHDGLLAVDFGSTSSSVAFQLRPMRQELERRVRSEHERYKAALEHHGGAPPPSS